MDNEERMCASVLRLLLDASALTILRKKRESQSAGFVVVVDERMGTSARFLGNLLRCLGADPRQFSRRTVCANYLAQRRRKRSLRPRRNHLGIFRDHEVETRSVDLP